MSRIKALAPKASGVLVAIFIGISSLVMGSATASADISCNDGCGSARFEAAWDWNYRGGDAFCWDTHSRFGTIWVENINRPGFHLELVDDGGQYPRVYWVR